MTDSIGLRLLRGLIRPYPGAFRRRHGDSIFMDHGVAAAESDDRARSWLPNEPRSCYPGRAPPGDGALLCPVPVASPAMSAGAISLLQMWRRP